MRKLIFGMIAVIGGVVVFSNVSCHEAAPAVIVNDSARMVQRGEYLVSAIGCDDCHSPKRMGPHGPEIVAELRFSGYPADRPLAAWDTNTAKSWALLNQDLTACVGPWGVSFAGNITSDATGIGNWTEQQFIKCLREGKWKGLDSARPLLPPMPWQNLKHLTDEDLGSIFQYLKTTRPVQNTVPAWMPPGKFTMGKQTASLSAKQ